MFKFSFSVFSLNFLEAACRSLFLLLGSLLSPSWWLLKQVLSAHLDLDALLQGGFTAQTCVELSLAIKALGPSVVLGQLMPGLLLCLAFSLGMLYLYGKLGQWLAHHVGKRLHLTAV